jgi:hypothetical protein
MEISGWPTISESIKPCRQLSNLEPRLLLDHFFETFSWGTNALSWGDKKAAKKFFSQRSNSFICLEWVCDNEALSV